MMRFYFPGTAWIVLLTFLISWLDQYVEIPYKFAIIAALGGVLKALEIYLRRSGSEVSVQARESAHPFWQWLFG